MINPSVSLPPNVHPKGPEDFRNVDVYASLHCGDQFLLFWAWDSKSFQPVCESSFWLDTCLMQIHASMLPSRPF